MQNIAITTAASFILGIGIFLYWKSRQFKIDLKKREAQMRRKMYELAILKELGDRVGYSLNVQNIIDMITGSLHQFIEYSVTSYMLFEQDKIIFKAHLEKSVSRKFIDEIKVRMLKSLSALLSKNFEKERIEEIISGAILVEELEEPVRSFFNIPLVIADKVVGVLTIAHTRAGLYQEEEMTILYKIVKQSSQAVTKLQEVVKSEERKLNAMVESMTEGVVMIDRNFRIMVVNPVAKKLIGISDKEDVSIFDFIDNLGEKFDIRGKFEESVALDKVLSSKDIFIKDRFFQIFVSPVKTVLAGKEEILGGVAIFHDITHDKELERMREDFISMMVHELRTPLDSSKKMIKMMEGGDLDEKRKGDYRSMIYDNASNMLNMVDDLLDAAKIEAGKFGIVSAPADISRIIKQRVDFFESSAADAKVKLSVQLDKNLPKTIALDSSRISQVLNNFISNALKYNKAEGKITVQALLHKKDQDITQESKKAAIEWFLSKELNKLAKMSDALVVAVTDTGIGINQDDIDQLFNKFKRLRAANIKTKTKGTGLGLVIAKGIIQAHKGIVGAESVEGEGSTFYFAIPINS